MAELKFKTIIAAGNLIFGLSEDGHVYHLMSRQVQVSEDKKSRKITSASWHLGPTTDDPPTVKTVGIEGEEM